ncbi:MAG: cytochrome P450, partial [Terrimicrobiaceae bacterium]
MSLPDGPRTPPTLQLIQWIANPLSFMRNCSERYGDCFTVYFGDRMPRAVVFSDPQSLQIILTSDESKQFDAPGELNVILEPLLGPQSVIGLSGDRHRSMRHLMMPPFHGERMRSYGELIADITDEVMRGCAIRKRFVLRKCMQTITLRVILRAVFGLEEGLRYQQMERALVSLLDALSTRLSVGFLYFPILRQNLGPLSPLGSFVRKREWIDRLIYDEIAERRTQQDTNRNDVLTLLMSAHDEAGEALTNGELRDELMTLLAAGHETTASA